MSVPVRTVEIDGSVSQGYPLRRLTLVEERRFLFAFWRAGEDRRVQLVEVQAFLGSKRIRLENREQLVPGEDEYFYFKIEPLLDCLC